MHHRIDSALRRLRQDLDACLDEAAVHDACRQAGHRWRDCLLRIADSITSRSSVRVV